MDGLVEDWRWHSAAQPGLALQATVTVTSNLLAMLFVVSTFVHRRSAMAQYYNGVYLISAAERFVFTVRRT